MKRQGNYYWLGLLFWWLSGTAAMAQGDSGTLIDIAAADPELSTFVSVVKAAGLEQTLSGPGPFTVFAPTNAAFANLREDALQTLLKPENKPRLLAILKAHVVNNKLLSSGLTNGHNERTGDGKVLHFSLRDNKTTVNDATIVKADLAAANGVLHVVDKVIMP